MLPSSLLLFESKSYALNAKLPTARAQQSPLAAIVLQNPSNEVVKRGAQQVREGEAGHGKGVAPPYGLNFLNGGPAAGIPSVIAPFILRNQEMDIWCHLSVHSSLSHEFLGVLVGKLRGKPSELWSSAAASEYTTIDCNCLQNPPLTAVVI